MYNEGFAPLLSIVIPTRNRQKYAVSSIESILRITDPGLEIVVQDNSDTPELEGLLSQNFQDSRLRYNYTSTPLSFVDNFDAAARLATGEYVCFIGDDDGVNPEIMEATRWAKAKGIDTIKPANSVSYLWPESGVPSTMFTDIPQKTGRLTIRPFSGKIIYPDNELELRKVVRKGGQEYLKTEMPKLYLGIVKRECLDCICENTGAYFGGLSPDIYAAVSIANTAKNSVSIDYPLILSGACPESGSVKSRIGEHAGNLEDAPHFKHRGPYEWADHVPRFYSVPTIWADSTIAALQDIGREDLMGIFNVPFLAASCLWSHPRYKKVILRDLYRALRLSGKSPILGTIQLAFSFLAGPGRLFFNRIVNRLRIILFGKSFFIEIQNINNIVEATDRLVRYLEETKCSFKTCIS